MHCYVVLSNVWDSDYSEQGFIAFCFKVATKNGHAPPPATQAN